MSEEQYASKRERQKARRAERLEREAAAAKSQRGRQRGIYAGLVVLVIALIGGLIYSQIAARQARDALANEVAGRLDELGCTEVQQMPDLGGGHLDPQTLAAQPPELLYTGEQPEPPSSGAHMPQVAPTGVFDEPIDPRLTTHNLEHGYLIAHYAPDAPEDQIQALKDWAQDNIDGDRPKMIVTPYYTDMANDANFAFTAWFQRQTCDTFDADVAEVFAQNHYETPDAPEVTAAVHNVGAGGVIDPEGEALLFPPLDSQLGTDSALDALEDAGAGSSEVDAEGEPAEEDAEGEPAAEDAEDAEEPAADEPTEAVTE